MSAPLEKHVLSSYFTVRIGIAVIAIAFPILLWVGVKVFKNLEHFRGEFR